MAKEVKRLDGAAIRIAVTGSRGKSGTARLLHAALCACGLKCRSRITGVLPRELSNSGERPILRAGCANVAEMEWWLGCLPLDTEALVLENSAVNPDLQSVCARLLKPTVTVLTNTRRDHEAMWGSTEESVLRALAPGLPQGGAVVLPAALAGRPDLRLLAKQKKLRLLPAADLDCFAGHLARNAALALEVCKYHGLDAEKCLNAMVNLKPDLADSCVLDVKGGKLAFAFSVNDVQSTEEFFQSLGWPREKTVVIYNHRRDRADRFEVFADWIGSQNWRDFVVIGERPFGIHAASYLHVRNIEELSDFIGRTGLCFGCGNVVHGLPLKLKLSLETEESAG